MQALGRYLSQYYKRLPESKITLLGSQAFGIYSAAYVAEIVSFEWYLS